MYFFVLFVLLLHIILYFIHNYVIILLYTFYIIVLNMDIQNLYIYYIIYEYQNFIYYCYHK